MGRGAARGEILLTHLWRVASGTDAEAWEGGGDSLNDRRPDDPWELGQAWQCAKIARRSRPDDGNTTSLTARSEIFQGRVDLHVVEVADCTTFSS
jgi:hypothetical protein